MQQLYVTTPFSNPISLEFLSEYDDISSLRSFLSSKYDIPSEILSFYHNSLLLSNGTLLNSLKGFVHANFSLLGGKGGFGSLLRGQAATKRKTTNFDASKDLKGRRIRNVENEKKLKEFLKKKEEEDENVEKELKKYKESEEKKSLRHYEMKLTQEYKNKLEDWENKMGKSIAMGFSKMRKDERGNHETENFEIPKKKVCLELNNRLRNLYENEPEEEQKVEKEEIHEIEKLTAKDEKNLKKKDETPEKLNPIENFPELDLKMMTSIEDLEKLGAEHLKHELMKLGLKCGGNLKERAQRLFEIKKDPTNLFNPKYLAKAKK